MPVSALFLVLLAGLSLSYGVVGQSPSLSYSINIDITRVGSSRGWYWCRRFIVIFVHTVAVSVGVVGVAPSWLVSNDR